MDPLGKGPKIRLRYNKIECAILGVVGLVVTNSFYRVLSGSQEVASKPLPPKAVASKLGEKAESYETKCRERGETFVTTASRVRITGPYCQGGSDTSINRSLASTPKTPRKTLEPLSLEATNGALSYTGTVFKDHVTKRFSTDFIPLEIGTNKIRLDFNYPFSKIFQLEINVERKDRN